MAKLTLSVDDEIVSRAKEYAKRQGVSVSKMVETYLAAVAEPSVSTSASTSASSKRLAPILQSVRGIIKSADIEGYRKHLTAKYR